MSFPWCPGYFSDWRHCDCGHDALPCRLVLRDLSWREPLRNLFRKIRRRNCAKSRASGRRHSTLDTTLRRSIGTLYPARPIQLVQLLPLLGLVEMKEQASARLDNESSFPFFL